MKPEWDKFWGKLLSVVKVNCRQECDILTHFKRNLDNYSRVLLLSGGLKLPFQKHTCDTDVFSLFLILYNLWTETDLLPEVP